MFESFKSMPLYMDYGGQKLSERIFQATILTFAVLGLVYGYVCQQFSKTVYTLGAGFVISCLITLPPWPMYRKNPLKWQPAQPEDHSNDGSGNPKSKKKK